MNIDDIQNKQTEHHSREHASQVSTGHSWWYNSNNSSTWGHWVCLEDISPFFESIAPSTFLVLGDGSGGRESHWIEEKGHDVLATDITTGALEEAKKRNWISKYEKINGENIPYPDNSFDFVFIKESLHHFPRPYLCLYEMIRVCKKGVIIIEPHYNTFRSDYLGYENCGNYSYRFSFFDFMQAAASLYLNGICYRYSHNPETFGLRGACGADLEGYIEQCENIMKDKDKNGVESRALLTTFIIKDIPEKYLEGCGFEFKYV